ncbi:MAG TPA: VOC family protein [Planctomycetaceae bacterium]|nr:VOC family protein [Planctomycetaceae bacterium]
MSKGPKPIPDGCHSVIPHLVVKDGASAIEFYKQAFGATELGRLAGPDGKSLLHAELRIGGGRVYLCDEPPRSTSKAPAAGSGTSVTLHVYVADVDAAFARAVQAGATVVMPVTDLFWGDRYGKLRDPFGHEWSLASHIEDVPPEEMPARAQEAFQKMRGA